jgi:hypothetical protein
MPWLRKQIQRLLVGNVLVIAFLCSAYTLWQPGLTISDGRDNKNRNALWMGHGWFGADIWYRENKRINQQNFRSSASIEKLAAVCAQNGISDVYPHLCPTEPSGAIAPWQDQQIERFLDNAPKLRVLPWIGGRLDGTAQISSKLWRAKFIASMTKLLRAHPRLAGVHLNFEPWNSEDGAMLVMLDEVRAALPPGKKLSLSAYPPPERFYPFRRAWSDAYFQQVAARCDQMALMSYDSSAQHTKIFQWFMARWTRRCLELTQNSPRKTRILMGVPSYEDPGTPWGATYHNPNVENIENSLSGIHRGLSEWKTTPSHFQGVAIYSEWVTSQEEWALFRRGWVNSSGSE